LAWTSGAVTGKWLEVIVKGNDALGGNDTNTGLASSYVFFFGNAQGDTGLGDTSAFVVDSSDGTSVLTHPHNAKSPAAISDVNDFNRDGLVDSSDGGTVLAHGTTAKTGMIFLKVAVAGPFAPDDGGGSAVASSLAANGSLGGGAGLKLPGVLSGLAGAVENYLHKLEESPEGQVILHEVETILHDLGVDEKVLDDLLADL
jgi:hypothetical protein